MQEVEKSLNSQKYNVTVDTNLDPSLTRMKLGAYSLPSLKSFNGQIQEEARKELRFPNASKVYKQMSLNADIASALNLMEAMVSRAKWRGVAPKFAPEVDKERAEKVDYNIRIMDRPFEEYISEILSMLVYGFHAPEKIYAKLDTPVGNFIGIKDLRTISQDTIDKWVFDETGYLAGLKQDISSINNSYSIAASVNSTTGNTSEIPRKKFILFRNNPKRDDPQGSSALRGAYVTWKYLELIQEFETIYTTKGLGGVLDLGIDVGFLSKAAADPSGPEASVLNQMRLGAANFHNGEQAYTETPLAYNEQGKPLFHTKILETTPPNTDEIIKRHSHRLLQCFFADILQLGANGGGSFALSDNKTTLVKIGIEHILNNIKRTLNHDLIPQIYKLNGWEYDARNACYLTYDDYDDGDIDILSKAVQRVMTSGAVQFTDDIEDVLRDRIFDLPALAEANTKIRENVNVTSAAGKGNGTSGTGAADTSMDSTTDNMENN